MSIDPNDQPIQPKRDVTPDPSGDQPVGGDHDVTAASEVMNTPTLATSPEAVTDEVRLPGDATGPAPGKSLSAASDGAGRPDKVAIAMMVGVVVLLLICVAFALAAR